MIDLFLYLEEFFGNALLDTIDKIKKHEIFKFGINS